MLITNDEQVLVSQINDENIHLNTGAIRPTTARRFTAKKRGSIYIAYLTANQVERYVKVKDDNRIDDWLLEAGFIAQRITFSQLTDGGGATGTKSLNGSIPAGAYYINTLVTDVDDWVGSAAVTYTLGDGTDVDRYNTGTPSLASNADYLSAGIPSGTLLHTAAITPVLTVTDDSDYGDITAGAMTIGMFYRGLLLG